MAKQPRIYLQIRKHKRGWLGHTLWKPPDVIARQALEWNPQGKHGRGRLRNTWWRTVLKETKGVNKTWAEIKTDAKNRVRWRIIVEALCSAAEWWDALYIYECMNWYRETVTPTLYHFQGLQLDASCYRVPANQLVVQVQ